MTMVSTVRRRQYAGVVGISLLLFSLQGCAGLTYVRSYGPFRFDRPFWTRTGEQIAVRFVPPGPVELWRGEQSGHDIVIDDERDTGLTEVVEPFRPDTSVLQERVLAQFRERGFHLTTPESSDLDDLHLSIATSWGVSREYLGLVPVIDDGDSKEYLLTLPLGEHRACFVIGGTLDQSLEAQQEHQVLWRGRARACEPIGRRWRDADQRVVVERAVAKAWTDAVVRFEKQLFSWSGNWGAQRTQRRTVHRQR